MGGEGRLRDPLRGEVSGPVSAHLGGWYLVNGQDPEAVFTAEPAVAAFFDALIPQLPADWEIVFTERYLGEEANLPGSFVLINATFYSNDPTAVPDGIIGNPDAQQVPVHGLALLALGLALAAAGRVRRRAS